MDSRINSIARSDDAVLGRLVDDLAGRVQRGELIDWDEVARDHPEHVGELRHLVPALAVLGEMSDIVGSGASSNEGEPLRGILGDFRIIREVGRGGMGVVYEAEQISLGRRVALKVLPFAATMDPKHLQRFKNEARAAASLHHEHIVPVYGIGCERSVHFYAMQFIDGVTLAQIIAEMKKQETTTKTPSHNEENQTASYSCLRDFVVNSPPPTSAIAAASTLIAPRDKAFYRRVAELGIQSAEALEYAHSMGVVHRDVKPGNLMLDAQGKLWVTDFGLAKIGTETGMTMSGDLLGTLRYMSPEQAMARHGLMDHRTDVYSLGATLYELLTGQPVVKGDDKQEILRQIAFEEPAAPRKLNGAIPVDLETVVLKAIEKNPGERYASAKDLADDLQRWLQDAPITARRQSLTKRGARWVRRYPRTTVALVVLLIVTMVGVWKWDRDRVATQNRREQARISAVEELERAQQFRRQERFAEARISAQRAAELTSGPDGDAPMHVQAQEFAADMALVHRLEEARLAQTTIVVMDSVLNDDRIVAEYRSAFAEFGIDPLVGDESDVEDLLSRRSIRNELTDHMVNWSLYSVNLVDRERLQRLAVNLSPDTGEFLWRLTTLQREENLDGLRQVANEALLAKPSPLILRTIASGIHDSLPNEAERLLWVGSLRFPNDAFLHHARAQLLEKMKPPRSLEALQHALAAVALRPRSPGVLANLGATLELLKRPSEAVEVYQRAIEFEPNADQIHHNLGNALRACGDMKGAEAAYRRAVELNPNSAVWRCSLGHLLQGSNRDEAAIAEFEEAIRIDPKFGEGHAALGKVYCKLNRIDEGETAILKALQLNPNSSFVHAAHGLILEARRKSQQAIVAYQTAVRLDPARFDAQYNLGLLLSNLGKVDEAEAAYRASIAAKADFAEPHCNLGRLLDRKGKFDEALEYMRCGHAFGSKSEHWQYPTAKWVRELEVKVERNRKLDLVLAGKARPDGVAELIQFADWCARLRDRPVAATQFYEQAFALDGKLPDRQIGLRCTAACAAALAGIGRGKDAPPAEGDRVRLRRQALDWLRTELATLQRLTEQPNFPPRAIALLQQLQKDADLAGVRDAEAIADYPETERTASRKFWSDVDDLLERLKNPSSKSGPLTKP